jgi:hypothetical protein
VPKTSDISLEDRIFALFKGEPKSGKSVAAASFPGPIYFFDLDGRMKPVRNFWPQRTDISYDTFTQDDYAKFEAKFNVILARNDYKTLVFDSLTSLALMVLKYSMSLRGRDGNKRGIIDLREVEDYGTESQALTDTLEEIRKFKCHVIVTAHVLETSQTDIKRKETTVTRTILTGGKKVAAMIPKNFDEIWHFNVDQSPEIGKPAERAIYTESVGEDFAGTALPLPRKIVFTGKGLYQVVADLLSQKGINLKV